MEKWHTGHGRNRKILVDNLDYVHVRVRVRVRLGLGLGAVPPWRVNQSINQSINQSEIMSVAKIT